MSECVKINGVTVKIGTCERLYYTTVTEFKKQLSKMTFAEGNLTPAEYLTQGEFLFRFPFPDEDDIKIGEHDDFNRGFLVYLTRSNKDVEILFPRSCENWPKVTGRISSYTQSPLSVYAEAENPNKGGDSVKIEIVAQQILANGHQAVIWRDPYSGEMRVIEEPEKAIRLARAILRTVAPKRHGEEYCKFIMTLCQRIAEGYGVTFDIPYQLEKEKN